jgi:hypothetical protein
MATAVGNGYIGAQLNGKLDTSRSWYGVKYISMMAKTAYPVVKEYIEAHKPIDRSFVNRYIQLFEEHHSDWLLDPEYVMRGRLLLSENAEDFDLFNRLFRPAPGDEGYKEISNDVLKKMRKNRGTKIIIINNNNKDKLQLIKDNFEELKGWHYDAKKDFVYSQFLETRTWLIVLNNTKGKTEEKLTGLIIK